MTSRLCVKGDDADLSTTDRFSGRTVDDPERTLSRVDETRQCHEICTVLVGLSDALMAEIVDGTGRPCRRVDKRLVRDRDPVRRTAAWPRPLSLAFLNDMPPDGLVQT